MCFKAIFTIFITFICIPVQAEQHRNQKAKAIFKYTHPCPATGNTKGSCPNYIIDHIKPVACGGSDSAENMQWQTKADSKAKDKWERKDC